MNDTVAPCSGVILAAGRGSRLKGITENQPKCFVRIDDRRLVDWQIEAFRKAGIRDIHIVTGYLADMMESLGVGTILNAEWNRTNMVGSLVRAIGEVPAPFIVSYSDILISKPLVQRLMNESGDFVITYDRDWRRLWERRFEDPLEDAETFRIDEGGIVREIGNRTDDVSRIQGQYMGLFKLGPPAVRWIEELLREDPSLYYSLDMTGLIQRLIERGKEIRGLATTGNWCEVDSETDLNIARALVKEGAITLE